MTKIPSEFPAFDLTGAQDNRGIAYREGDLYIYRASAVGSCVRALVASMLGYEEGRYDATQEMLELAAGQGDLLEGHVLEEITKQGYQISQRQLTVEVQVLPGIIVRGHTDGLIESGPGIVDLAGAEVKTMSQDRFAKWISSGRELRDGGEFSRYGWQIAPYWRGMNLMYDGRVNQYVYAVINRNSGKVDVMVLDEPPVSWRKVRQKVIEAQKWVMRGELPPCDVTSGAERYFCPFVFLHDEEGGTGETLLDDVTNVVISGLATRYHELSQVIKAGKAAEEERRPISQELMRHVPRGAKVKAGQFVVTGSGGSSKRTDWYAIAADLNIPLDEAKAKYEKEFKYEYPLVKIAKEAK